MTTNAQPLPKVAKQPHDQHDGSQHQNNELKEVSVKGHAPTLLAEISPDDLWYQWGHGGSHVGRGTEDCPRERHHHHDERCYPPPIMRLLSVMTQTRYVQMRGFLWSRA